MTREEAINVIKGARKYLTVGNPIWNVKKVDEAMNMAIEALSVANLKKEFESADAVQGEWIHDGQNFKGGLDWCHCSECGCKTSANGLSMYNYCPNCGADMRGSRE